KSGRECGVHSEHDAVRSRDHRLDAPLTERHIPTAGQMPRMSIVRRAEDAPSVDVVGSEEHPVVAGEKTDEQGTARRAACRLEEMLRAEDAGHEYQDDDNCQTESRCS